MNIEKSRHSQCENDGIFFNYSASLLHSAKSLSTYSVSFTFVKELTRGTTISPTIYRHSYDSEKKLYDDIDDFVLLWYNSVRPHSANGGLSPRQKRLA